MKIKSCLSVLALSLLFSDNTLFAEEGSVGVRPGMTFSDVLKLKGPPLEKDVHETSRVVLWRYKDETLKFYDGRLLPRPTGAVRDDLVIPEKATARGGEGGALPGGKEVSPHGIPKSDISQKTVDEIIDALPNESAGGSGSNSGVGNPLVPPPPPSMPMDEE